MSSGIGPRIGHRSLPALAREILQLSNWAMLGRLGRIHDRPFKALVDEVLGRGRYPRTLSFETPVGRASVRLFHPNDLSTLHLIFCRGDYVYPDDLRVVVDIGSNIGLSCLFWLTRNTEVVVSAWEPVPRSATRLRENLQPFHERLVLSDDCVSDFRGPVRIGVDPSGVYSAIGLASDETVEAECVHIMDVLEPVLCRHDRIDVLKVDNEGHERRTLQAIEPAAWRRIRVLNVDRCGARGVVPSDFRESRRGSAERFVRA